MIKGIQETTLINRKIIVVNLKKELIMCIPYENGAET